MTVNKISNEEWCKSFWRTKSPRARLTEKQQYEKIIAIAEGRLPANKTRKIPWMLPHWKQGLVWLVELMEELGELDNKIPASQ